MIRGRRETCRGSGKTGNVAVAPPSRGEALEKADRLRGALSTRVPSAAHRPESAHGRRRRSGGGARVERVSAMGIVRRVTDVSVGVSDDERAFA